MKQILAEATRFLALITVLGSIAVWAADTRYVQSDDMVRMKLDSLQREATFLEIKEQQGEATRAEQIYLKTLQRDIEATKQRLAK